MPILKIKTDKFEKPPACSIKSIKFKQLKQFKIFDEAPLDLLGENFN